MRFRCPACKAILDSPGQRAGAKINCPRCNQRLEIPGPSNLSRTVLGEPIPERNEEPATTLTSSSEMPTRTSRKKLFLLSASGCLLSVGLLLCWAGIVLLTVGEDKDGVSRPSTNDSRSSADDSRPLTNNSIMEAESKSPHIMVTIKNITLEKLPKGTLSRTSKFSDYRLHVSVIFTNLDKNEIKMNDLDWMRLTKLEVADSNDIPFYEEGNVGLVHSALSALNTGFTVLVPGENPHPMPARPVTPVALKVGETKAGGDTFHIPAIRRHDTEFSSFTYLQVSTAGVKLRVPVSRVKGYR